MKLSEYVKELQRILEVEGEMDVVYDKLFHYEPAEKPLIKKDINSTLYLIINPNR